jgi:Rnl2 family RNA ligase
MAIQLLAFPKIPTSRCDASSSDEWVASEKIHGAQLVIGVDEAQVRIGKRKAWLEADEPFFGWQLLRPVLQNAARALHRTLGGSGELWIYGELFGGQYPHAAVAPVPGLVPVQTGIWYAPDLRYAVFDLVHAQVGQEPLFLAHDSVQQLIAETELLSVPVLGHGKFSALDQLPLRFPTRVPKVLGLPALERNDAEGYVIKPSAQTAVSHRPMIKKKIAEFDERRFDESSAFDPDVYLSREGLLALASRAINAARIASARSKVGTDPERVVEEAVLDALVDLRDLLPRRIEALAAEEERELLEQLRTHARAQLQRSALHE